MEKKKFMDGTELGSKREPATKASSARDGATGIIELCDDALDAVVGGYIFYVSRDDGSDCWEVIDDHTGNVLASGPSAYWARDEAKKQNQKPYEIRWEVVDALRRRRG